MILEIAQIEIKEGSEVAFEAGVREAVKLFQSAEGCHGMELQRGIERPGHYYLMVRWGSVDDHVAFRESPAFPRWRELVGPHFAGAPQMEHVKTVVS